MLTPFPKRPDASAPPPAHAHARNPGMGLDLGTVRAVRVNASASARRAATIPARRAIKKDWQAAWLLKAITCIDLTTLAGDDTANRVRRLCAKAARPLSDDLAEALGLGERRVTCGAVCVYHTYVADAVAALDGTGIPVAAVSTGFPAGLTPHDLKLREIEASVADGAEEIDVVVTRAKVLRGDWAALYDEVKDFRAACGEAHLKVILATGELGTLRNVAKASLVSMMAGADFIKTSTGKETANATLPVALAMARTIRQYGEATGYKVGFKPAGGISNAKTALAFQTLMYEELGTPWLQPDLFRFGASSLLGDIERQLEHHVTGRYSAAHRHAIS